MPQQRHLVIAGTHQEYMFWCRENKVDHVRGAKFASGLDAVRGLRAEDWIVTLYGTYRRDMWDIREYLGSHGFKLPW